VDYSAYLRVLLSVWVGLGLGQLVQAVHRLARFRGTVKWDWLPLAWAALAFLMFVQTWWAYFTILQAPIWRNLFAFLLPLSTFIILYLICVSALPDLTKAAEGSVVDLKAHYLGQNRYFFSLWAALLILAVIISSIARGGIDIVGGDGFRIAAVAAAFSLIRSSDRRIHVGVTIASLVALVLYIVLFTLRFA
jgi:hypothetical protein